MKTCPKVSIIVPVYNVEHYLHKCIDSILAQTFFDFELILVDDGSTDNCGIICNEYAIIDPRIIVIHKKNGGVSSARNSGLDEAKGEYIGWVDSDDYIETDMYETLYQLAIDYNTNIAECNYAQVVNGKLTPCEFGIGLENGSGNFLIEKFLSADIFYGIVTKLFHRSLFETVRFPQGRIYEDTWMTLNFCLEQHKYVRNAVVKYYYEQTHDSIIRSILAPNKAREYIYILENQFTLINSKVYDSKLKKRLHTRIMEKSVMWYLGLALSDSKLIRDVYAKLYLKRMNFSISSCILSKNTTTKNKISYLLCQLHFAGFVRFLKRKL